MTSPTLHRALLLAIALLLSACGSSHGRDDDGGLFDDGGVETDAGRVDSGSGELCGALVCAVGQTCCAACGGLYCAPGGSTCPPIPCPVIIRSCDQALELGSTGLPCVFEGGCGSTDSGCCPRSAQCIDGFTVVQQTCLPDCVPPCATSSDCAPDQFCELASSCEPTSGHCAPRPMGCTADCPGVCGCDGTFYCNACGANAAGTSVRHGTGGDEPTPDDPSTCIPPPSTDCRTTGCPSDTTCELCWESYACLPPGAVC